MTTRWPSKKDIKEVLEYLEGVEGSRFLGDSATTVEKIKHDLCREFVIYLREKSLTQKALAGKLNLDPALMSKILRYRFDEFTIDRLVNLLELLNKDISIKIA